MRRHMLLKIHRFSTRSPDFRAAWCICIMLIGSCIPFSPKESIIPWFNAALGNVPVFTIFMFLSLDASFTIPQRTPKWVS